MERVTIELPQVIETQNMTQKRTATLEFTSNGKVISKNEADEIIQKWIEYIKKLIPQAKFDFQNMGKANWETNKNMTTFNGELKKLAIVTSQNVEDYLEDEPSSTEKKKSKKEGYYYIYLFSVEWKINNHNDDLITIAELDFRLVEGKPVAYIYEFNQLGDSDNESKIYDSWEEGVRMFLQTGKEWFEKYGAEINLLLPE